MLYFSEFKSLENHTNKLYRVELITNKDDSDTHELQLSYKSPVIIETDSEGIFSPIKARSCTITILTDEVIPDLYTPENQGISVVVKNITDNEIVFEGFVTPIAYSQPYAKSLDTLELEVIDGISSLKNIPYTQISNTRTIKTVQEILYKVFEKTGYSGDLYCMYDSLDGNDFSLLKLSESNFFDDDEEQTPWTCYDVLEQCCLFFGWSAVSYKNNMLLVDYETLQKTDTYYTWRKISNPFSSLVSILDNNLITINKDSYTGTDTNLSYDEVYNKISLNDSIYEIEEITTDIFDTDKNMLINNARTTIGSSRFIHYHKNKEDKAWQIFWTTYRFNSNANWKLKYFSMDNFSETEFYQNGIENLNYGPTDWVNGWGNTIFAMPERYWILDDYAALTSSIDAKEVIAFNELTYKKAHSFSSSNDVTNYLSGVYNCPVLTYEFPEEIQWKAANGYSYICFKGDLFYQCDHSRTEVWLDDFFVVYPFDGIETMAGEYNKYTRNSNNQDYNKGWAMLKAKLQIGDQYWNGSTWTETETTFDIYYHKEMMSLSGGDDEVLSYGAWQHPVYNTIVTGNDVNFTNIDPTKLIGEDCLAIPIPNSVFGKLKFTLYPPKQAYVISIWADYDYTQICPVVYMKDFELSYKYVPANYNLINIDEYESDSDIIYTNIINENYVTDFDEVELKINTAADNKPISRSYIMDSANNYIVNLTKNGVTKRQEHNLVNMYYDHYNSPKKIYECSIHDYLHPGSPVQITATEGNFIIDTQSYDLKENHNTIKLIEY